MARSPEERIKQFLDKHAEDARAAAEAAAEKDRQNRKKAETADQVREKWHSDAALIGEVVSELQQKLPSLTLTFESSGGEGRAIAIGTLTGRFLEKDIKLLLEVLPTGRIQAKSTFIQGPPITIRSVGAGTFDVLTASKVAYENFLLDLLGVEP